MKQFLLILVIACCAMPSCTKSSEETDKPVAGIVAQAGSVAVTTEDLTQALMLMPVPQQFEYLSDEGRKLLIDMLIDWKLLSKEALKAGLGDDPAVGAMLENAATDYERIQILGSAYLRLRMDQLPPVSDKQIQEYYASHSSDFLLAGRRKVNRILFVNEDRARKALPQLQSGMDFDQYKKQYLSERIKIDTVWLQTTENPNEFESAVYKLNVGETSDRITTQSGVCVVRVVEKVPAKQLPLAEVRERIRKQLRDRAERDLIAALKISLREGLAIDVNSSLLKSYECDECGSRETLSDAARQSG